MPGKVHVIILRIWLFVTYIHNNEPLENEVDFQTGYRKVIDYK